MYDFCTEVTPINRQRYMAELSKLLTFMYKEDRAEILQHYNELLDNAEDEQELLESFGSPTKLAVTISRTYQRDERKLSVKSDSKADAAAAPAPAVRAPEAKPKETPAQPEQSYADIIEEIRREQAAEAGVEYKPIFFNEPEPAVEAAPAEDATSETDEAPAEDAPAETEEASAEDAPAETEEAPAEDAPAETDEAPAEGAPAETDEAPAEDAPAETEEAPAEDATSETEEASAEDAPAETEEAPSEGAPAETELRTNVFLLIVYLIFAVPIGLALYAVLIALDLVLIGLGLGAAGAAIETLTFAFSGMAVFADAIMVAGMGLVEGAIGLVLLWFAVWLSIKDIGALSRGIVALGRKLCVREVRVDE